MKRTIDSSWKVLIHYGRGSRIRKGRPDQPANHLEFVLSTKVVKGTKLFRLFFSKYVGAGSVDNIQEAINTLTIVLQDKTIEAIRAELDDQVLCLGRYSEYVATFLKDSWGYLDFVE